MVVAIESRESQRMQTDVQQYIGELQVILNIAIQVRFIILSLDVLAIWGVETNVELSVAETITGYLSWPGSQSISDS